MLAKPLANAYGKHAPPALESDGQRDRQLVIEVMRQNMFATLVSVSPAEGILASHLPFVYEPERGEHGTLFAHTARANPHGQRQGDEALAGYVRRYNGI